MPKKVLHSQSKKREENLRQLLMLRSSFQILLQQNMIDISKMLLMINQTKTKNKNKTLERRKQNVPNCRIFLGFPLAVHCDQYLTEHILPLCFHHFFLYRWPAWRYITPVMFISIFYNTPRFFELEVYQLQSGNFDAAEHDQSFMNRPRL